MHPPVAVWPRNTNSRLRSTTASRRLNGYVRFTVLMFIVLILTSHLQVVQNEPLLKADLNKGFLVGGHSAGASLAAVVVHEARDDPFFSGPGQQITGQVIREPLVIHPEVYHDE